MRGKRNPRVRSVPGKMHPMLPELQYRSRVMRLNTSLLAFLWDTQSQYII